MSQITIQNRHIHHVMRQGFGGYRLYWKLYPQIWSQTQAAFKLYPGSSSRKFMSFLGFCSLLLLKTPWWLVIKPLGQCFSTVCEFNGSFTIKNQVVVQSSLRKLKSWQLFRLTMLKLPCRITSQDWSQHLLKNDPTVSVAAGV